MLENNIIEGKEVNITERKHNYYHVRNQTLFTWIVFKSI
jgi:hypothetical protein